jgi:hypothetical protein
MTVTPQTTVQPRVVGGAVTGAVALNVVTVAWAFYASSTSSIIAAAVGITFLGLVFGGAVAWATASNHWSSWWVEGRHRRGAIRGQRDDATAR